MKRIEFILYTGALLAPIKVLPKIKKRTLLGDWNNLTNKQKIIRDFSYEYGKKFRLEKTLTAIAWQESSFGKKLRNPKEESRGIFGGYAVTVARRHFKLGAYYDPIKDRTVYTLPTPQQLRYVKGRLLLEKEFAAEHAILQLQEGISITNINKITPRLGKWQYIWAYYNGGTNCENEPLALKYASNIYKKVKIIRLSGYNG